MGPPDVAVVGGVGGEGLPAVLALERPLSGVLADMCAQNTRGGEGLEEKEEGTKQPVRMRFSFVFMFNSQFRQQKDGTKWFKTTVYKQQ